MFRVGCNNNGKRVQKSGLLGKGGFAEVNKARLYHKDVAVKTIDVTKTYLTVGKTTTSIVDLIEQVSGIHSEALRQAKFYHPNVLSIIEFWFQFEDLKNNFEEQF